MKQILILITALLLFALVGCTVSEASSSTGSTESFPAVDNTESSSSTGNTENSSTTVNTESSSVTGNTESTSTTENTESSSVTGNTEHTSSTEGLEIPADVELAMKTAYQKRYADAALGIRYYGCYDGAHVGFVDGTGEYPWVEWEEVIGGLTFRYSSGQKLDVYKDGEILKLKEAYEVGWLTADGLKQLLDYYKTVKFYLYEE